MILLLSQREPNRARHLLDLPQPALWPAWPFLPVIRRTPGTQEADCGLLYDPPTAMEPKPGVTVSRGNRFVLPKAAAAFLKLPKEDASAEAAFEAGGRID